MDLKAKVVRAWHLSSRDVYLVRSGGGVIIP